MPLRQTPFDGIDSVAFIEAIILDSRFRFARILQHHSPWGVLVDSQMQMEAGQPLERKQNEAAQQQGCRPTLEMPIRPKWGLTQSA